MTTRVHHEIIVDASQERLAQELYRVEAFPQYMHDVEEVVILERSKDRQISAWRVNIDGVELAWQEEDRIFSDEGRMEYRILQGDFDIFEGVWQLTPEGNNGRRATRVQLTVEYDLGLPAFEELIGEILEIKVRRNTKSLLEALKARVEQGEFHYDKVHS